MLAAVLGAGIVAALSVTATAPAGAVVIAQTYTEQNYLGTFLQWNGPNACTVSKSNTDYQVKNLVDHNFNDVIRSYWAGNNCQLRLFEHINFGGASVGYFGSADTLGSMDEETSSIKFS
jgi:hypothetical protein